MDTYELFMKYIFNKCDECVFMIKVIIFHSQAENRSAYGRLSTEMGKLKYFGAENSFSYDV